MTDDERAIVAVVEAFFAAFTSGPDAAQRLEALREVLLPEALVVRTCGGGTTTYDVESFIAPRAALLAAVPIPRPSARQALAPLKGEIPSPSQPPPGCHFHTRCPHALERCREEVPALREVAPGHRAACHLVQAVVHIR